MRCDYPQDDSKRLSDPAANCCKSNVAANSQFTSSRLHVRFQNHTLWNRLTTDDDGR